MKVPYRPALAKINIVLGVTWLGLGIAGFFMNEDFSWVDYLYIGLGFFYLVYFVLLKNHYFKIDQNKILMSGLFQKPILFTESYEGYIFADEYVFKQGNKEIRILLKSIAKDSVEPFKTYVREQNLLTQAT